MNRLVFILTTLVFQFNIHAILAQEAKPAIKDTTKKETLADKIKSSKKKEGLFTIYQDTTNGSMMFYIKKSQIGVEYLYQSFSMGGPPELFLNQNMIRETWLFKIRKNFDKLYWTRSNTNFYHDPANPISKSALVDVSETVFFSDKIVIEDSLGYLLNVDNLFLSEKLDPIKPNVPPTIPQTAYLNLGTFNKDKSEYIKHRVFPKNLDIVVNLAYENPAPQYYGGPDITDPRYINVKMQHSFVELPQDNYTPRVDHPQIGYFNVQADNMTTQENNYYHDFINRWNLKKKNPELALSEPIEPITWWVENTTPLEVRQTVLDAGNKWNIAFEKAGFKNAVVMKMMPDDATWDPADIRYNVIRWVPSDLGYAIGPTFVNPRTGQILGGDITIEYGFLRGTYRETELYLNGKSSFEIAPYNLKNYACSLGHGLKMQQEFGQTYINLFDGTVEDKQKLQNEFITELVLHEMGHTMGLMHNMKSSHMLSPAQLKDISITSTMGITGSVMDYSIINLSPDASQKLNYYTTTPGPYDLWAIEYGYKEYSKEEEKSALEKLANRSIEPNLIFGNDADICYAGGGIDPRVMTWDMSNDPVTYAKERLVIVSNGMKKLNAKFIQPNQSYDTYRHMFYTLFYQRLNALNVVSHYVGGIYVDRSFPNQNSKNKPFTPVSRSEQESAVKLIVDNMFDPKAFEQDQFAYNYLQIQRRGYNFFGAPEDPKIDAMTNNAYNSLLYNMLNASTLRRMSNSSLYGNKYLVSDLFEDLTKGIFNADLKGNTNLFRRNLQRLYVKNIIDIVENKSQQYPSDAQAQAFHTLKSISKKIKQARRGDDETVAHRALLHKEIRKVVRGK